LTFVSEGRGLFNGEEIGYGIVAGETFIRDETSTPIASFFSVAYIKSNVADASSRAVTFLFNGGPGSSSQWLHMGAFGPKRVTIAADPDNAGASPYDIVDNTFCLLDTTDLVFIDPIGTGYSRALGNKDPKTFWGLLEDANSIVAFIRTWISENRRWNSPKYLIGESYGTTRAALVADLLGAKFISLNGIVLIAPVLDYQNSRPRAGDGAIMPYVSYLPTFAAVAWYHGKIDRGGLQLEAFLNDARKFARTDYAVALIANGHRLGREDRLRLVSQLCRFTGLKQSYIEQSNFRIQVSRFFKELLRDEGRVLGRLDGRYTGVETDHIGETAESDPAIDAVGSAYTSALHHHLATLGVSMDREYHTLNNIDEHWKWQLQDKVPNGAGYINVVPYLGRAMRHNKDLRVLTVSGYYDLATPFFGAENALSQDGLAHERITYRYYESGHLIYLHEPSRERLLKDAGQFISGAPR